MSDSIQNVEDLKNAYPELCKKIFEEGVNQTAQISQKYIQERIKKSIDTISTLLMQFNKDVGFAVVRSFIWDPVEQEDPQLLRWLADSGIDLDDFGLNDIN